MGMSGDLKTAIAEGSTMIRVGSALFGKGKIRAFLYRDCLHTKILDASLQL